MIRLMEERDGGDQVAVIGGVGGIRPNVGDLDIQWQRKFVHSGGRRQRQHSWSGRGLTTAAERKRDEGGK